MRSALVTGAGSGIGAAVSLRLAAEGFAVTLLDRNEAGLNDVLRQITSKGGSGLAWALDVRDEAAQEAAFDEHASHWDGPPSVVILSAGLGDKGVDSLLAGDTKSWKLVVDVNLSALIHGTALAMKRMEPGGVIQLLASAAGVFPMPPQPVYAATKAGVVQLTRSLAPDLWRNRRIRVTSICPQFVDTPLVSGMRTAMPDTSAALLAAVGGQIIETSTVVNEMMKIVNSPEQAPEVLLILADGTVGPYPRRRKSAAPAAYRGQALAAWAAAPVPSELKCVQVHSLSDNFRAATALCSMQLTPLGGLPSGSVVVRRLYTGVNASDVNFSAGRYFGSPKAAKALLPFTAGFESVGAIVAIGERVKGLKVGQPVATVTFGGFSDYAVLEQKHLIPVPEASPVVVAMLTSGLTASIGLEQAGALGCGETVLVTAAAGGTGQFAVQLAKLAGNYVVGTCGGAAKAKLLAGLGVDRVIDYHKEDVKDVLKKEFPKGIDVVYESVGGEMFRTCVGALAQGGRMVVIGMMSQYGKGWPQSAHPGLTETLLWKSASCRGFFLPHFTRHYRRHLEKLVSLHRRGVLKVAIDKEFMGLDSVPDAVEYLQSGKSLGKVVVRVADMAPVASPPSRL